MVRLIPLGAAGPFIRDQGVFAAVVSAGFSQRRKTLRNALQKYIDSDGLLRLGIDPGVRAETLPVAAFAAIANAVALVQGVADGS